MAASGQEFMCGPLSVEYMTNVLSAIPGIVQRLEHRPDVLVMVNHGVGIFTHPPAGLAKDFLV